MVGLGTAAMAWVTIPVFQKIYLLSVPESLPAEQLEQVTRMGKWVRYISIAGAFVGTLIAWFVSAFLIWLIVQVFEGRGAFKAIFSVISHASIASLLSAIIVLAVVFVKIRSGMTDLQELDVRLGADLFVDGTVHPALTVVLANLNPFNLWYYSLITVGIGTVCNLNRTRSAGVVGTFWVLAMGFGAGIAWFADIFNAPSSSF